MIINEEKEIESCVFVTVALSDHVEVKRRVLGMQSKELQQEVVHILSNFGFILHVISVLVRIRLSKEKI